MSTYLAMNRDKLRHNYLFLDSLFENHNVGWAVVTKILCGNKKFLKELIAIGKEQYFCDSRLSNIKTIKEISEDAKTIYIKPPPKNIIPAIVSYVDVSFNSSSKTIKFLSEEACLQNKVHSIVVMIEMGDLREGVMEKSLSDFFSKITSYKGIEIIGIGGNFNCLSGTMPSRKKFEKLIRIKKSIENEFRINIPYISGGATIAIPLLMQNEVPKEINHFRVGEALFCGTNLFNNKKIEGMKKNVFTLSSQIIDIAEKPYFPDGVIGVNSTGIKSEFDKEKKGKSSVRAILDIGLLDVNPIYVKPLKSQYSIIGASSDMMVVDLKNNDKKLKVGDSLEFSLEYMGILSVMNSRYIKKIVV